MAIPTPQRSVLFEQRAQERAFNFQETQANYKNVMAKRQEDRINITQKIQDKFRTNINPLLVGQQKLINQRKKIENLRFGKETPHIIKGLKNANLITDDQVEVLKQTQGDRVTILGQAAQQSVIRTVSDQITQDISSYKKEEADRFKQFDQMMLHMQLGTGPYADEDGGPSKGLLAMNHDTIYQAWLQAPWYRKHYKAMSMEERKAIEHRNSNAYNRVQKYLSELNK